MAKNKVTVVINSRQYTMCSDESVEYMKGLADHLNEKIEVILKSGNNVMGERPIILAALNVCDEYFKMVEAGFTMQEQMEKRTQKNEELKEENKKLQALLKESEYEIDIDAMQKQLVDYSKEIQALQSKLNKAEKENKARQNEIKKLKEAHEKAMDQLKTEYSQKEQEMLKMIDNM